MFAFLNITRFPLNLLAQALKAYNDAKVSVQRLNRFFLLPVLNISSKPFSDAEKPSIVINNANYCWNLPTDEQIENGNDDSSYFSLKGLKFETLKSNELIAIVGSVGSGKSSFISALLQEIPKISGECKVVGNISYCAQTPWYVFERLIH
jgi:ABC-type transport system involved in cytochrome bd biosynthesis fused ATPase/permease subunit